jgi:hypothetical protein
MPRVTLLEVQAWGEKSKLLPALQQLDLPLLDQVETEVVGRLSTVADTSTWTDSDGTPGMAKTIIAKLYVAWLIDRQYSEDEGLSDYAALLRTSATVLLNGILASEIDIPGVVANSDGLPSSYPTDNDPGPYFCMDATF